VSANNERFVIADIRRGLLEIDDQGRIWRVASVFRNNITKETRIKPILRKRAEHNTGRYLSIASHMYRGRVTCLAHRVVWIYANGKIQDGLQINHINGIKTDNRPCNLELVTQKENIHHAFRTGLSKVHFGETHANSKLSNKDVVEIRKAYSSGCYSQKDIAEKYMVKNTVVSRIVNGKGWKHLFVEGDQCIKFPVIGERCWNSKLTEESVIDIRRMYSEGGVTLIEIGNRFGVSHQNIRSIVRGFTWKHVEMP
jgi:hypothetical protein